jgi:hypothetical protein
MIAVIYIPENDRRYGDQAFSYIVKEGRSIAAPVGKANAAVIAPIETQNLWIKKGVTFVEKEVWEKVKELPNNQSMISLLEGKNALFVVHPCENPVGATSDYENLEDLGQIISNIQYKEKTWLERSLLKDNRPEVFKMIRDRLDELKEERANRAQEEGSIF